MHRQRCCLCGLIAVGALTLASGVWVEITQHQTSSTTKPGVIKVLDHSTAQHPFSPDSTATTPSPQWLEYQFERFGQLPLRNQSAQQLVVSSGEHLPNSAQIVVSSSPALAKNRLFQTKTQLDVINDKPDSALVELPLHLETTSRQSQNTHTDGSDEQEYVLEVVEPPHTAGIDGSAEPADTGLQIPSIKGFFTFLKSMQKTWLKNTGSGIEHKIKLLKDLRDNLMRTIEKQFSLLWLPDENERQRRQRRGLLDDSNLNFPPEAALMSINFLTFAVFLIKLVLQVVHIVKSKHYNFSGFNVNTEPISKTGIRN